MPNKQKLFTYGFKYFNVDEKALKSFSLYAIWAFWVERFIV